MSDDPRSRHVHTPGENGCWETVSICTAQDLPQHECDQSCVQLNLTCGYRAEY